MRTHIILALVLGSSMLVFAQGPCTEGAVKDGKLSMADDAFSYMASVRKTCAPPQVAPK